jgi:hypothetical protein
MENADRERPERKPDEVDEREVEAVEGGEAEAGSRREEVERAAEREEKAGEG